LTGRPGGGSEKPALRRGAGRPALRLGGRASAAMALADVREKELEKRESVRLLYVAMTRAREELWLLGREKPDAGSLASHLLPSGSWPADGRDGRLPVERVSAASVPEPPPAPAPAPSALDGAAVAREWEKRGRWREAAASPRARAATAYLREAPKRPAVAEDGERSVSGAEVGQLCHRVLQDWDYRAGGDLPAAVARARGILERRAPSPRWAEAAREAESILGSFLESAAARELASAEILGREVPFAYADGATVVRGSADLVYRSGKKIIVADYKSEPVAEKSAADVRARYAEQGRAYVEAVRRAWGETPEFRVLFLRRPDL
jgi:ATP-dependent exoDNAse (exonuclease V) beta subunit